MNDRMQRAQTHWLRRVLAEIDSFSGATAGRGELEALRGRLVELAWADGCPTADSLVADGDADRFRRHPLASVVAEGCSALLMYWPPGHASLPHDHGGLWGIEIALDGRLEVDEYVRSGDAAEPTLAHVRSLSLAPGDAAVFSGAQYVHRCRNLSNVAAVLTLHVYGGTLSAYTAFEADAPGRYRSVAKTAQSDRALLERRRGP